MTASILAIANADKEVDALCGKLSTEGYLTFRASTVEAGQEILTIADIDIVLLDESAGISASIPFVKLLRRNGRTRRIPVFIMSSSTQRSHIIRAITAGATDYLVKPLSFPVLKSRLWSRLKQLSTNEPSDTGIANAPKRSRILVIDDNDSNRKILCNRVAANGHEATAATTGTEGLELMEQRSFDLVLLDVMMPDMDGLAVLRLIKADDRFRDIPVIMISASDAAEHVEGSLALGATDYITKPFNVTLLQTRINAALHGKLRHDRDKGFLDKRPDRIPLQPR